ncbi:MAG: hypothetical protein ACPG8W_24415 [Candidatus Promineifilaceae bacterium]
MTRRRLIPLAGILLVIALTYLLLNSSLITEVLAPFIYATLLTISSALNSLPQLLVWVICMMIVVQMLTTGLARFARAIYKKQYFTQQQQPERTLSPVQKYQRWLNHANQGVYFRKRISERVMRVILETNEQGGTYSRPQLEQAIRDNRYHVPDNIHQYLIDGIESQATSETPADRIQSMLNTRPNDHSDFAQVLTYLEASLEIRNLFDKDEMKKNEEF